MSGAPGLLDEQFVLDLEASTVAQSLGGAFYGVYLVFTALSSYVLISQNIDKLSSRLLLAAIILMFLCDTGSLVTEIISERYQILTLGPPPYKSNEALIQLATAIIVLARINYLLSDALVIWRAWILFMERKSLFRIILAFCFCCSFVAVFVDGAFTLIEAKSEDGMGGIPFNTRVILPTVLLATNIVVTSLFALRAWEYRMMTKGLQIHRSRTTQVGWILALFFESGLIYCSIWMVALLAVCNRMSANGINLLGSVLPHLTGIYPTIVILLVFMDRKRRDSPRNELELRTLSSLHFYSARTGLTNSVLTRPTRTTIPE